MNVTFRLASEELEKKFVKEVDRGRARRAEGPPLRRRHARVDLQRVPRRRRRRARRVHAGVRAEARIDTASRSASCGRRGVPSAGDGRRRRRRRRRRRGGGGSAAPASASNVPGRFDEAAPVLEHLGRARRGSRARSALRGTGRGASARAARAATGSCRSAAAAGRGSAAAVRRRAGQRQHAERRRGSLRRSSSGASARGDGAARVAERHEQRAEQDRVGQRLGRLLEAPPVGVERRQRLARARRRASSAARGAIGSSSRRSASMRNARSAAPARSSL